jgi:hypothetical protein
MQDKIKYSKQKISNSGFELTQKENGREGIDFIIKIDNGNTHELYLQFLELDKQREIKINKQQLGEPKDNLWIALILYLEGKELGLYLIPSKQLAKPDDYIFIDNPQSERLAYLANWEIKVFKRGMDELNKYRLENQVENLI